MRESSLGSAGAEGEVDDAGERRRREARERDEGEDAAARRALNDTPDSSRDGGAGGHKWCSSERSARSERPVPDDRGRDAETEAGERPPAPAYRCGPAKSDDDCGHDEGDEGETAAERDKRDEERTEVG